MTLPVAVEAFHPGLSPEDASDQNNIRLFAMRPAIIEIGSNHA
jgi:hypothetical protein